MRSPSHTTVRSVSLPTSRGRVARSEKPMPAYSVHIKRDAVRRYETGLSCRAVAQHMKAEGVASPHYVTVLRWAKDAGIGRKTHGRRFALSGEIVRALYDRGMDVDEIAQRFRVGT